MAGHLGHPGPAAVLSVSNTDDGHVQIHRRARAENIATDSIWSLGTAQMDSAKVRKNKTFLFLDEVVLLSRLAYQSSSFIIFFFLDQVTLSGSPNSN